MNLQEKLDQMRTEFENSAPSEALTVMHKATEDLKNSNLMDNTLKKGDALPAFDLSDQNGEMISSAKLLETGPLIISFYRGVW